MKTRRSKRPNFAERIGEKHIGGAGDTITLYDASKFAIEMHDEALNDIRNIIISMEEKDFYEDVILDEVKKYIKNRSSNP
jgi:hypothetical protein